MRLLLDNDPQFLTVRRYMAGEIDVRGQLIHTPCILSAARLITEWTEHAAADLDLGVLEPLLALGPNIILIGTDAEAPRSGAVLRATLAARGVAIEFMDLGAACRTYNVLVQERREVVAGLFP